MKIGFIFSGQGSQYVGMGKELYENFQSFRSICERANEALDFNITNLMFHGEKEQLNITENTQPAILTMSAGILSILKEKGIEAEAVAGLSLGEYSALYASSAIDFETCVKLVKKRGHYMQEAVPLGVGGMAAIIGLSEEKLKECKITFLRIHKSILVNFLFVTKIAKGQVILKNKVELPMSENGYKNIQKRFDGEDICNIDLN